MSRSARARLPGWGTATAQALSAWQRLRLLGVRMRRDPLSRNGLFIVATTLVNSAFGYVFWVIGARLFPAAAVGIVAATISAASVVGILAYAGVGMTLIHSLPQARTGRDWSLTVLSGTTITALIGIGGSLLVVAVLPATSDKFLLLHQFGTATIFALGTLAWSLGSALDYAFIAERKAQFMLGRNAVHAAAKVLAVIVLALLLARSPTILLLSWSAAAVVGALAGGGFLVWRLSHGRLFRPAWRQLLRSAGDLRTRLVGHQVISISGQLPPLLLPIVVTTRLSARADAFFYLTWLLTGVLLVVSAAVADSLFAEGAHQPAAIRGRALFALKLVAGIVVPLMIVFFVAGGLLLSIFGPSYSAHALDLLYVLVLAAIPDALTNLYVALLRLQSRFVVASTLNLGMGLGTVVLSWLLLPIFGITGAGIAWLAMQLAGCLFCLADLLRRPLRPPSALSTNLPDAKR